jgi:hypothetical protein
VTLPDGPQPDGQPLPVPGQRISSITFPQAYHPPGKPDAGTSSLVQDAYRQTQFVLGGDLRLFAEGMALQLRILNDSSHSRYRNHAYAAICGAWARVYAALDDACLLVTRGSYATAPNIVRSACELIAAEHQLHGAEMGEFVAWMLGHLRPNDEHKAFDVGLGHYFAGTTLAEDAHLRIVYRAASRDVARDSARVE